MQPCSQPWYGLMDCENGMSGESLCAMIERARWIVTAVRSGAGCSSSTGCVQPSSHASRRSSRKRFAGLNVAPRPLMGGDGGSFVLIVRLAEREARAVYRINIRYRHRDVQRG